CESLDSTGGWLSASRFKRCAYSMNSGWDNYKAAPVGSKIVWHAIYHEPPAFKAFTDLRP
ncbi:hypothetical protein AB2S22_27985, partial [Pseudomonas putida]|uniref:hypothetical protein n=1 Tax=Pseudomonas putida TaxID=303 RepID=UPI003462A503